MFISYIPPFPVCNL